jgi:quercetin 2,3-dioxygenase
VATGVLDLEGAGVLLAGDAARLTDDGGRLLTAGHNGAEVLVWEMRPS